jgi:hypothetical protein
VFVVPQIIAVDNNHISVIENNETAVFESFDDLLSNSQVAYRDVIENDDVVIKHIITSASKNLDFIRLENSNAAGLIGVSSIEQANRISSLVKNGLMKKQLSLPIRKVSQQLLFNDSNTQTPGGLLL